MRNRVEKLRGWLLGSAIFLVLVIAAFIGTARYVKHRFLKNLTSRLGVSIVRESNGYSDCKTIKGITVFCVHAAKEIEHTDGKFALHDVSIELYGQKGDRHDRIYGDEFEYDKNAGVVRAEGVVHIDMQAADAAAMADKSGAPSTGVPQSKVLHVTTSGLVYMQKLGEAATGDAVEFQIGGLTGHAVGADYNSDSGMLMLHSAVSMSGLSGNRPVALTASTADMDSHNNQVFLTHAKYESQGKTGEADQATLDRRPDGTLSRVQAQGNVTIQAKGGTTVSQRADVVLTATSQPKSALLTGGVRYSAEQPLRRVVAQADAATITFDAQSKPQPDHAVFSGAVHIAERTRATESSRDPWSTRDLTAAKVEAALVPAGVGNSQLRDAEASGSAHLTIMDNGSLAVPGGKGRTELSGDDLKAHLIDTGDAKQPPQLDTLAGRGNTVLRQLSAKGVEQTSSGDVLDAKFRPKSVTIGAGERAAAVVPARSTTAGAAKAENAPGDAAADSHSIADDLLSAVQEGHVTMTRHAPRRTGPTSPDAKPGATTATRDVVQRAIAEKAAYDGNLQRAVLTGGVEFTEDGSTLWANQVALDQTSGDSHASGAVNVDYVQPPEPANGPKTTKGEGSAQAVPTHIVADRADQNHETGVATFYGKPVRLWQGGSQVQAPVIELSRAEQRLTARGDPPTGSPTGSPAAQVHTVLAAQAKDATSAAEHSGPGAARPAGCAAPASEATKSAPDKKATDLAASNAVRIASGGLIYSGILRQADFTGGFRADTVDANIRADQATVFLQQTAKPAGGVATPTPPTSEPPSLGGDIERVDATGRVEIDRPGLHATGEKLLYTQADHKYVLTGDSKNLPKAVDARGTTTGAALVFNSCDDSVEALSAAGQPVRTESRVRSGQKKEKGKR